MRILPTIAAILLITACAPRPPVVTPTPVPTVVKPTGALFGVTASDLVARFGQPTFQVREGQGTKLQWAENGCVLDAYLYPPEGGRGTERVMHVDTRRPSGADIDLNSCLAMLVR